MDNFVNLHVHTLFSKQDAIIKINELVDKVIEYNQKAVAVTDHSSTAAHYYLQEACKNKDVKPIFGNEFYTNISYDKKTRDRDHLVCLGMTDEGVKNINRLQDIAVHNRYYKPLVSYEILPDYTEGVFATSACSLGTIPKLILQDKLDEASDYANWFADIFNENFALELQMHPQYEDQYKVNDILVLMSEELDIPLIVSSDAHFLTEEDADIRRIIQCIAWKKRYEDGRDSLLSNCLGNSEKILNNARLLDFDLNIVKKAMSNACSVADKCNGKLCNSDRKIPIFDKFNEFDMLFEEGL